MAKDEACPKIFHGNNDRNIPEQTNPIFDKLLIYSTKSMIFSCWCDKVVEQNNIQGQTKKQHVVRY